MKTKIVGIEQGRFTSKEGEVISYYSIHLVNEDEGIYLGGIPWKESLPKKLFIELDELNVELKKLGDSLFMKEVALDYDIRTKKLKSIEVLNV